MVGSVVRDWQSHDNEGRSRSALGYLNISLYRRQGFEVMGKTSSVAVPLVTPMDREWPDPNCVNDSASTLQVRVAQW